MSAADDNDAVCVCGHPAWAHLQRLCDRPGMCKEDCEPPHLLEHEQIQLARALGLCAGFDVDSLEVQMHHLVAGGEHLKMRPICGADTLWVYYDSTDYEWVDCEPCITKLEKLRPRLERRMQRSPSGAREASALRGSRLKAQGSRPIR